MTPKNKGSERITRNVEYGGESRTERHQTEKDEGEEVKMQRTSDIFNAANLFKNTTNKVALPNPHITMRKKNTIIGDDQ